LVIAAAPKIVSAATALAVLAWLSLLLGLVYANFVVSESLPNPVIVFSTKGLTSLLVELASLAIGCLGLLLVAIAFGLAARNRALAFAAIGNASVCAVCVALLM
jgi:hypothetical protein